MLWPYPHDMKAIWTEGIQDKVRPEEINKKAEPNDGAPKNTAVPLNYVRRRHAKYKAPFVFCDSITFSESV